MAHDNALTCSCGCAEPHVIAHRETADGARLAIWSTGEVTHSFGVYLRGLGAGRSAYARRTRIAAVRLILDDVSLFTAAELPTVIKVAEKTFAHTYSSQVDQHNHALALAQRKLNTGSVRAVRHNGR